MHHAVKIIAPLAIAAAVVAAIVASSSSSARPADGYAGVAATNEYASPPPPSPALASDIIAGRLVTAKYVTDLARAKADGYHIITRMIRTWATTS
jgi:hypothetical protein